MPRKIELIWDFFGDDSEGTARHHAVHLEEFMRKENKPFLKIDIRLMDVSDALASITIDEELVVFVRDRLKPHRARLVEV